MKSQILIPLMAGLALLCACKGKHNNESADSATTPTENSKAAGSRTDNVQTGPKLVKTADIHFKVKNVQQTSEKIATLTSSLGGMVIHHTINSTADKSADIKKSSDSLLRVTVINTVGEMTVKIPPMNMESFMIQVSNMGVFINNSRMDINDKTLAYLSTKLKLKNQAELVADQKKNGADAKNPDNLLAFKNNMIDQQIENHRTDDSVKNSIITLSFYENKVVNKELIANDDLSAYNPPFISSLGLSLQNGWDMFMTVVVFFANAWILVPIGAIGWFVYRFILKKKREPVLVKN